MKEIASEYYSIMFGLKHLHGGCKLCIASTGEKFGRHPPHIPGGNCPQVRGWARNRCFDCLTTHAKGRCNYLDWIDHCRARRFASGDQKVCGGCLVGDDSRNDLVHKFHLPPYGFGPRRCRVGFQGPCLSLCLYLLEERKDILELIVGQRSPYRSCFTGTKSDEDVKKSFIKFLFKFWSRGIKITNAVVIFVVYFHNFKGTNSIQYDEDFVRKLQKLKPEAQCI